MNAYQAEQIAAFEQIRLHLPKLKTQLHQTQAGSLDAYLSFRQLSDRFLDQYFSGICNTTCYQNQHSACCSKDGIITFFADMVINILYSNESELDRMALRLQIPHLGLKCLYLTPDGCMWAIKPVVCQMFLCERAQLEVFSRYPQAKEQWKTLTRKRRDFTWPDKPILFDTIESLFMAAGCTSPLMYLHNSPGLLRVKRKAGAPNRLRRK
jgi:hypothetical protein